MSHLTAKKLIRDLMDVQHDLEFNSNSNNYDALKNKADDLVKQIKALESYSGEYITESEV